MAWPGLTAFRSSAIMGTVVSSLKPHGLSSSVIVAGGPTAAGGTNGPSNAPSGGAAISVITAAAVPVPGPAFLCNGSPAVLRIYNPTDGQPVYLGVDNTLNATTGFLLSPGFVIAFESYQGPVWGLSGNLATTLYYLTQATT